MAHPRATDPPKAGPFGAGLLEPLPPRARPVPVLEGPTGLSHDPVGSRRPARVEREHRRRGTCNLFTFFALHLAWSTRTSRAGVPIRRSHAPLGLAAARWRSRSPIPEPPVGATPHPCSDDPTSPDSVPG